MAHSNRQKLRDDRGGKTRHQDQKAQRKARYGNTFDPQARIKELEAWQRKMEEDRQQKGKSAVVVARKKHINMWPTTIERRKGALERLKTMVIVAEREVIREHGASSPEHKYFLGTDWLSTRNVQISILLKRI